MNDEFVNELVNDVEQFIKSKKKLEKSYNKFSIFGCFGCNDSIELELDDRMDDYHEKLIILKSKYIKSRPNKKSKSQDYSLAKNYYPFAEDNENNIIPIPSAPPMNQ